MFKTPQQIWTRGRIKPPAPRAGDSLEAFGSEGSIPPKNALTVVPTSSSPGRSKVRRVAWVLALVVIPALGISGFLVQKKYGPFFGVQAASGALTIESDPAGAEVLAGGVSQGRTPLTLSVTPGAHAFELVHGERRTTLRTVARGGATVVHHVQFDSAAPAPVRTTSLRIVTEPAGLRVLLDGAPAGASPVTIDDIAAGAHRVQVIGASRTFERQVDVAAGESASVIISASAGPAGPAAGWLTVSSPIALQIVERDDIIGTSQSPRILLPAGRHELLLTNETLGFSERRVVQVSAGASASIRVEPPKGRLSVNALPWAEVWVDGQRIGETPVGNHMVTAGTHEILFRHPELGERRQTVTVSLKGPARVSVDMRKPGS